MRVGISADSTCDLSPELYRNLNVICAPLSVIIGEKVLHDSVDVTPRDIFAAVGAGRTVTTAAVNEFEYAALFGKMLTEYDEVVHICISSSMSSCFRSACAAAEKTGRVHVVDSANLSTGTGLLVMKAVGMAAAGESGAEIAKALENMRDKVDASFTVQDIDYLRRGGRCGSLEAAGAKLLHIRPSIEVREGAMYAGKKYRGSTEHYLKHYIEDRLENPEEIDFTRAFITHSPCEEGMVRFAMDQVASYGLFRELIDTTAGCSVCTHCGPNTLGLLFMRK